ncbi:hypothetical protein RJK19_01430 [Buchnera aphidicola (Ceratovacuna keduensis)]|uniref:CAF17-like 4Fe-4S cluster assembly/insertion protein YgfZ n=1 Tax=Buchnera aphidicola TaxID=9 RepID=UPI0031B87011
MKENFFLYHFNKLFYSNKPILIYLKNISITFISGKDRKEYLQNQFTNDLNILKKYEYNYGSYCNISGKVISIFLIFDYFDNSYACLHRKSISNIQFNEIKKYSVFSKINILKKKKLKVFGIFGKKAKILLEKCFDISFNKFNVIKKDNFIFLRINDEIEKFIVIFSDNKINIFKKKIFNKFKKKKCIEWDFLLMISGFPILEIENCKKFNPISLNLEKFNAINFNKGCYKGQEILSKIKYKNFNKKKIFLLYGISKKIPKIGSRIFKFVNNDYIFFGIVLFSIKINNFVLVQCILNNSVNKSILFKIENIKKSIFFIKNFYI